MGKIHTISCNTDMYYPRARGVIGLCRCEHYVIVILLLAGLLFTHSVLASPAQVVQEIGVDSADISSPQTTLASLMRLTDSFHELVRDKGYTRDNAGRIKNISQQIEKLFDLREIPPKYKKNVAVETAVYLREALARFPVPSLEEVPDEERMIAWIKDGKAALYRLPGTPLVIRKTDAGIYEGRYQISSATVAETKSWYEVVKAYPYVSEQQYIEGLYEEYFLTPGPMIPIELIRALPDWMQAHYLGQTVWQWLLLITSVLILVGAVTLLYSLINRLGAGLNSMQQNLVLMLWPISVIYLTLASRYFIEEEVFITGEVLQQVILVDKLIILAAVVSLIMRFGSVITEAMLSLKQFSTRQIDRQLLRLGIKMLTILVSVIIVMEGMQKIGFSLATLVAGAGVTGLAIALAAQDTLKNVFGGLLLAMDRPFEVGQRVKIKGYEGFIKQVGLRSIRVRTLAGHEIIIPNDEAARIEVENIGRRPFIRRDLSITITYDTPPDKINRAVEILREILAVPEVSSDESSEPHPNEAINQPDYPPKVYFNNLNADSLNLLVAYWFHPPDQWESVAFAHRINMQIMEQFNAEGIDFAFPSQTMYLAGDNKRPINFGQRSPLQETAIPVATPVTSKDPNVVQKAPAKSEKSSEDASIEQELLYSEGDNDST